VTGEGKHLSAAQPADKILMSAAQPADKILMSAAQPADKILMSAALSPTRVWDGKPRERECARAENRRRD
jgi:hypothetical protein